MNFAHSSFTLGAFRGRLLCAWILALAHVGEPVLGNSACLLDCELTESADCRLPTLTRVGGMLHHEDLSTGARDLQEKPRTTVSRSSYSLAPNVAVSTAVFVSFI